MFYYDNKGKIYFELVDGVELFECDKDLPSPPLAYVGEIWFDNVMNCLVDDREVLYWYTYENGAFVKHDWAKRYADGEFTLGQFRDKVLAKLKSDYNRKAQTTDGVVLMYTKRKALGALEDGDEGLFATALEAYRISTNSYRAARDAVKSATSIDELISVFST